MSPGILPVYFSMLNTTVLLGGIASAVTLAHLKELNDLFLGRVRCRFKSS